MSKGVAIFGATSGIAKACARRYAAQGARLFLVGRNEGSLHVLADDLRARGASQATVVVSDLTKVGEHADLCRAAFRELGQVDIVLVAHGVLPSQRGWEENPASAEGAVSTNFTSAAALIEACANSLVQQGHGSIVVLGSVAGDRPRKSNYFYGATKAALHFVAKGMAMRLAPHGVRVVLVKPGLVETPMTESFEKGPLWAKPDEVARKIVKAVDRRRRAVYVPGFWWGIMWIVRSIPDSIMKRLNF